jgi:flagellar FliL protein
MFEMGDDANKLLGVPTNAPSAVKKTTPVWVFASVALLVVATGGGSAWLVVQHGRADAAPAATPGDSGAPKFVVHLDGFTVNLADLEETHFLRVTMDLGLDHLPGGSEKDGAGHGLPVARIRDSILKVLTMCKADPLLTPEGKTQLKKNLLDSLNRDAPELGVRDVYFTEFLVQR